MFFFLHSTFSFQDYEKQTDNRSGDISYTQMRVCLWHKSHCKEVQSAARVAIICHTRHPLCLCVYNYTAENDKQNKTPITTAWFVQRHILFIPDKQMETLPNTSKCTFLMMFILAVNTLKCALAQLTCFKVSLTERQVANISETIIPSPSAAN